MGRMILKNYGVKSKILKGMVIYLFITIVDKNTISFLTFAIKLFYLLRAKSIQAENTARMRIFAGLFAML